MANKATILGKKNRVTVPTFVREFLELQKGDKIIWTFKGNDICVVKFHQ